jgi:hypothetical protein
MANIWSNSKAILDITDESDRDTKIFLVEIVVFLVEIVVIVNQKQ